MEELIGWAVLFGKFWVIAQVLGYVLALVLTAMVIGILVRIFREMR